MQMGCKLTWTHWVHLYLVALRLAFCAAIYYIWIERNRRIFDKCNRHKQSTLWDIIHIIRSKILLLKLDGNLDPKDDFLAAKLKRPKFSKPELIKTWNWIPPDEGRFKLNSDASLCQTEAAIRGLIRNSNNNIITAFSINMPPKSIQELEMQAILVGTASARKLGLNHLWIESDSLFAVNDINGKIKCLWKANSNSLQPQIPILFNLKAFLGEFQSWKITHIWREANSAADLLSKTNCCIKGEDLPPSNLLPDLMALVLDDSYGSLYTRL
ncbi:uncharacterized protein LOC143882884 [Tasmannia lanceolata]|uniref:uncharacterized protein LOC143882884 n=1 Tax=Tasmannia lanceolata TaxID=3420 RepID=UPI00406332B4